MNWVKHKWARDGVLKRVDKKKARHHWVQVASTQELFRNSNVKLLTKKMLKKVWNLSLKSTSMTEDWNKGHMTLMFKKGFREDTGNCKPESLMSDSGELAESIIKRKRYEASRTVMANLWHRCLTLHTTTFGLIHQHSPILGKIECDLHIFHFCKYYKNWYFFI